LIFLVVAAAASGIGQTLAVPGKILYVTTSAGFRHDSLPVSVEVLKGICARTRTCEITHTEDTTEINGANLQQFKAVLFFTSGELPLSIEQKQALLNFIGNGGAFGGFHSATDTLYTWPEYGKLIGAYFAGHPWTQQARILAEPTDHLITESVPSPWALTEEYYQFRDFISDQTKVLLSLDKSSVDLAAAGVTATEFPLAWVRPYLRGRVFYTALGHFDDTWRSQVFQRLLENSLAWMLSPPLQIAPDGVGNAATITPSGIVSPGSLISIFGSGLTAQDRANSFSGTYAESLAGTTVVLSGRKLPLLYAGPDQINALVPPDVTGIPCTALIGNPCLTDRAGAMEISNPLGSFTKRVFFSRTTPGLFTTTVRPGVATVWATGLGAVTRAGDGLYHTDRPVTAVIGGARAEVLYAGWSPEYPGLYQINVSLPESIGRQDSVQIEFFMDGSPLLTAQLPAQ